MVSDYEIVTVGERSIFWSCESCRRLPEPKHHSGERYILKNCEECVQV